MNYDIISSQRSKNTICFNIQSAFYQEKKFKHTPLYTCISLFELFIYCRWYCLKALHVHENFYME